MYIYALVFSVNLPPCYRAMKPRHPHSYVYWPIIGLLAFLPLFPHLVEFLATTIGLFNATCEGYDSRNSNHTHPQLPHVHRGGEP